MAEAKGPLYAAYTATYYRGCKGWEKAWPMSMSRLCLPGHPVHERVSQPSQRRLREVTKFYREAIWGVVGG